MAHPKHRTSPVTPKRSLESAGKIIDLIGKTFSKDTNTYQGSNNVTYNTTDKNKRPQKKSGGIHIDPSKKGTFTAAATKHGMGVQEFASKVLRNKENYSPSLVKKANFARNASKWSH